MMAWDQPAVPRGSSLAADGAQGGHGLVGQVGRAVALQGDDDDAVPAGTLAIKSARAAASASLPPGVVSKPRRSSSLPVSGSMTATL